MKWCFSTIADDIHAAIESAERELRVEQAVRGLDSMDEKQLQSLLALRLSDRYTVSREVHYPSSRGNRLTHRQRCDLVLSPKGRPIHLDARPPGLFDPTDLCPPEQALWLEMKVACQFREGGVRHAGYGAQWRTAVVDDLRKMETEPAIREAGLLMLVFTESADVLEKDLQLFEDVLIEKQVLAGFRQVRQVSVLDRIGHRQCAVALWPTVQR